MKHSAISFIISFTNSLFLYLNCYYFQDYEESETPVQISNFGLGTSQDFLLYPSTVIQSSPTTKFDHKAPPAGKITSIKDITTEIIGRPINIQVRIVSTKTSEEIKPGLTKMDCIASDITGTIRY